MHISDGVLSPWALAAGFAASGAATALALRKVRDRDYPRMGLMAAAFFVASLLHIKVPPTSVHLTLHGLCGAVLGIRALPVIMIGLALQAALLGHGGFTTLGINACLFGFPAWAAGAWLRGRLRSHGSGWPAFAVSVALPLAGLGLIGVDLVGRRDLFVRPAFWAWAVPVWGAVSAGCVAGLGRIPGRRTFRLGAAAGALATLASAAMLVAVLRLAPLAPDLQRDALRTVADYAFVAHAPVMLIELVLTGMVTAYLARAFPDTLGLPEPAVPLAAPAEGGSP